MSYFLASLDERRSFHDCFLTVVDKLTVVCFPDLCELLLNYLHVVQLILCDDDFALLPSHQSLTFVLISRTQKKFGFWICANLKVGFTLLVRLIFFLFLA